MKTNKINRMFIYNLAQILAPIFALNQPDYIYNKQWDHVAQNASIKVKEFYMNHLILTPSK